MKALEKLRRSFDEDTENLHTAKPSEPQSVWQTFLKGISNVQDTRPNAKGNTKLEKETVSRSMTFGSRQTWIQIPALSINGYKILGN